MNSDISCFGLAFEADHKDWDVLIIVFEEIVQYYYHCVNSPESYEDNYEWHRIRKFVSDRTEKLYTSQDILKIWESIKEELIVKCPYQLPVSKDVPAWTYFESLSDFLVENSLVCTEDTLLHKLMLVYSKQRFKFMKVNVHTDKENLVIITKIQQCIIKTENTASAKKGINVLELWTKVAAEYERTFRRKIEEKCLQKKFRLLLRRTFYKLKMQEKGDKSIALSEAEQILTALIPKLNQGYLDNDLMLNNGEPGHSAQTSTTVPPTAESAIQESQTAPTLPAIKPLSVTVRPSTASQIEQDFPSKGISRITVLIEGDWLPSSVRLESTSKTNSAEIVSEPASSHTFKSVENVPKSDPDLVTIDNLPYDANTAMIKAMSEIVSTKCSVNNSVSMKSEQDIVNKLPTPAIVSIVDISDDEDNDVEITSPVVAAEDCIDITDSPRLNSEVTVFNTLRNELRIDETNDCSDKLDKNKMAGSHITSRCDLSNETSIIIEDVSVDVIDLTNDIIASQELADSRKNSSTPKIVAVVDITDDEPKNVPDENHVVPENLPEKVIIKEAMEDIYVTPEISTMPKNTSQPFGIDSSESMEESPDDKNLNVLSESAVIPIAKADSVIPEIAITPNITLQNSEPPESAATPEAAVSDQITMTTVALIETPENGDMPQITAVSETDITGSVATISPEKRNVDIVKEFKEFTEFLKSTEASDNIIRESSSGIKINGVSSLTGDSIGTSKDDASMRSSDDLTLATEVYKVTLTTTEHETVSLCESKEANITDGEHTNRSNVNDAASVVNDHASPSSVVESADPLQSLEDEIVVMDSDTLRDRQIEELTVGMDYSDSQEDELMDTDISMLIFQLLMKITRIEGSSGTQLIPNNKSWYILKASLEKFGLKLKESDLVKNCNKMLSDVQRKEIQISEQELKILHHFQEVFINRQWDDSGKELSIENNLQKERTSSKDAEIQKNNEEKSKISNAKIQSVVEEAECDSIGKRVLNIVSVNGDEEKGIEPHKKKQKVMGDNIDEENIMESKNIPVEDVMSKELEEARQADGAVMTIEKNEIITIEDDEELPNMSCKKSNMATPIVSSIPFKDVGSSFVDSERDLQTAAHKNISFDSSHLGREYIDISEMTLLEHAPYVKRAIPMENFGNPVPNIPTHFHSYELGVQNNSNNMAMPIIPPDMIASDMNLYRHNGCWSCLTAQYRNILFPNGLQPIPFPYNNYADMDRYTAPRNNRIPNKKEPPKKRKYVRKKITAKPTEIVASEPVASPVSSDNLVIDMSDGDYDFRFSLTGYDDRQNRELSLADSHPRSMSNVKNSNVEVDRVNMMPHTVTEATGSHRIDNENAKNTFYGDHDYTQLSFTDHGIGEHGESSATNGYSRSSNSNVDNSDVNRLNIVLHTITETTDGDQIANQKTATSDIIKGLLKNKDINLDTITAESSNSLSKNTTNHSYVLVRNSKKIPVNTVPKVIIRRVSCVNDLSDIITDHASKENNSQINPASDDHTTNPGTSHVTSDVGGVTNLPEDTSVDSVMPSATSKTKRGKKRDLYCDRNLTPVKKKLVSRRPNKSKS